ncbi:MAG: sigma-70 family RNA polymerase sigma factor [Acidobacteriota bacterium]|nr:sigma-70 family RNA polymerase sigma factor [Acidobacteriota bacterium]
MFLAAFSPMDKSGASSDAALVHLLLQNDVSAFEKLYDKYSRVVYSLVLRIVQQSGPAEEVMQDVFLQVWRNSAQYDANRGPFFPWLITLARNRALDSLRLKSERQRRLENQTDELYSVVVAPQYEKELDEKRRAERIRSLVGGLKPEQKRAIELAYFQGLSHSEIAAELKEPLGTVKSWIRNGLMRLKEGLQTAS